MVRTVRKLPPAEGGRVETGAVQFGDDWPGLFVRGDDCMSLAQSIRRILESLTPEQARELTPHAVRLQGIAEVVNTDVLLH